MSSVDKSHKFGQGTKCHFLSWKGKGDYAEGRNREREREMHEVGDKGEFGKVQYKIFFLTLNKLF